MAKGILGACAILFYGSLAMASGMASEGSGQSLDALTTDRDSVMLQISDDERERRVEVCEREWEFCMDWCKKSKGGSTCREKCTNNLADCMKKIPYAN